MNRNQKSILVLAGIIILLGILFWLGKPGSSNSEKTADLSNFGDASFSARETSFDFGTISMAAGHVNHNFRVKNIGTKPVTVERLYTSCMCTSAEFIQNGKKSGPFGMPGHGFVPPLKKVIAPEEEINITVTFDPSAHGPAGVGPFQRTIYLDDRSSNLLTLEIEGIVTP